MAKRWQTADVSYLRRYGRTKPVDELARRFKTDVKTVREKLAELAPPAAAAKKKAVPAKAAAARPSTSKPSAAKASAAKPSAVKRSASQPAPARSAPKPTAKKTAPARSAPAKTAQSKPAPAKATPMKKTPTRPPAAKTAPAKKPAEKPSAAKATPAKAATPKPQPAKPAAGKEAAPPKPAPPQPAPPKPAPPKPPPAKDSGLAGYTDALTAMHKQDWAKAVRLLDRLAVDDDQPEIAARARVFLLAAKQRLGSGEEEGGEDAYLQAVFEKNRGNLASALEICRRGGRDKKDERFAYLTASVYALEGRSEEAAQALTQAVELNPKNRINAYHDADFAELRKDRDFRHLFDFP
jgi:hypothetical protein